MSFAQSGLIKMMRVYCHSRSVTISVTNQIGLPICDSALQCLQRCSWQDALGRPDCSEQFEIRTKTLSSLYVTYHFQLTITNLRASCLPPIDDCSVKSHQRCCWRRILFPPVFPYAGDYFGHPTERWDWIKSMHSFLRSLSPYIQSE